LVDSDVVVYGVHGPDIIFLLNISYCIAFWFQLNVEVLNYVVVYGVHGPNIILLLNI